MTQESGSRGGLVVIALAFFFVGGIFFAIGGRSLLEEWSYARRGVRAEAVAIGKALRFATDTTNTAYEISYEVVLEARRYERTEAVPVHLWERVETGMVLPVEYRRGQPDSLRTVVASHEMRNALLWSALGCGLILAGLIAVVCLVRPRTFSGPPADVPVVAAGDVRSHWALARQSSEFWLGSIVLTVGTPLLLAGAWESYGEWRFWSDARVVDGIVLTKESRHTRRSERRTAHEATYRFVIADATFEGRARLPRHVWTPLVERQPVQVLYLPYAPSMSRLDGSRSWTGSVLIGLLGCLFTAIGVRVLVSSVRSAKLEWSSLGGRP